VIALRPIELTSRKKQSTINTQTTSNNGAKNNRQRKTRENSDQLNEETKAKSNAYQIEYQHDCFLKNNLRRRRYNLKEIA